MMMNRPTWREQNVMITQDKITTMNKIFTDNYNKHHF